MKFDKSTVEAAINNADSIKEFLTILGLKVNNGNYRQAWRIAQDFGFDLQSVKDRSSSVTPSQGGFYSDEEYFVLGKLRNSGSTKRRLIKDGMKNECSKCHLPPWWNEEPITLQLDHVNGNSFDNRKENLRLLCPNCHSQTKTYANNGMNKRYEYCQCGDRVHTETKHLHTCR